MNEMMERARGYHNYREEVAPGEWPKLSWYDRDLNQYVELQLCDDAGEVKGLDVWGLGDRLWRVHFRCPEGPPKDDYNEDIRYLWQALIEYRIKHWRLIPLADVEKAYQDYIDKITDAGKSFKSYIEKGNIDGIASWTGEIVELDEKETREAAACFAGETEPDSFNNLGMPDTKGPLFQL